MQRRDPQTSRRPGYVTRHLPLHLDGPAVDSLNATIFTKIIIVYNSNPLIDVAQQAAQQVHVKFYNRPKKPKTCQDSLQHHR